VLHPDEQAPIGRVPMEGLGTTSAWFPWALLGGDGLPRPPLPVST